MTFLTHHKTLLPFTGAQLRPRVSPPVVLSRPSLPSPPPCSVLCLRKLPGEASTFQTSSPKLGFLKSDSSFLCFSLVLSRSCSSRLTWVSETEFYSSCCFSLGCNYLLLPASETGTKTRHSALGLGNSSRTKLEHLRNGG